MTTTRPWPKLQPIATRAPVGELPAGSTTLHLIGDVHAGAGALQSWRMDGVAADFRRSRTGLVTPLAHIQLGDNTDGGAEAQNLIFEQFKTRLPAPVYEAQGNHDLFSQTPSQWAARWGHPSQNYIVDFAKIRLIFLGGEVGTSPEWTRLAQATLTFLDSALAGTTKPCFVCCHFPLWDTCGGDPALEYTSKAVGFFVNTAARTADSNDILAVLAVHSNFKAWIAGHTHSRVTVPGLVVPVVTGAVRFVSINASAIWYQGLDHGSQVGQALDQLNTLFATWVDTGRMEVRIRSHGAGGWIAPQGRPVVSVVGL